MSSFTNADMTVLSLLLQLSSLYALSRRRLADSHFSDELYSSFTSVLSNCNVMVMVAIILNQSETSYNGLNADLGLGLYFIK